MKPTLLVLIPLRPPAHAALSHAFELRHAADPASRAAAFATPDPAVRAVLTNGSTGLRADEIDRLPGVELIGALGAGHENIARDHAHARGIAVVNGAGTNDACVADHAFALLLAVVRGIVRLDAACRAGVWRDALPMQPNLSGRRLGILGLGHIGAHVARRALGFDLALGYHSRRRRDGVAHRYFDSPEALARWADFVVVSTPGGAATRHLVDARVLDALGPQGYLVNVSRGSVVDTAALADALRARRIAGAGLDVYEGEPQPPAALLDLDNVVLTPHVGGTSPEAVDAAVRLFVDNAARHFAGEALLTPI
ncbi:2-hydroxyacid dehydrogenase [Burkholderia sp. FERM BP-3421]|uniref:2-hydroxyacid dehydrogenase n=1 Tax=Burkholderia sp. FERM BP-3421 TaxID=1494466 RepID=UPI00236110F4|nr:2-hydroxyacid dehydrogenase [Burkholderia sp. FERM BP-3421]WDD91524.1 2-hydroxyacid dehydrogenase [Burkholderia sp. FERM BP-3421]